jgi:hypothetical protein
MTNTVSAKAGIQCRSSEEPLIAAFRGNDDMSVAAIGGTIIAGLVKTLA